MKARLTNDTKNEKSDKPEYPGTMAAWDLHKMPHIADDRAVRPKGRFLGHLSSLQPMEYLPMPDDVRTAIDEVVDRYHEEAYHDYLLQEKTGRRNHIYRWLVVLAQWTIDCHIYLTDHYVREVPADNEVFGSVEYVLCCLRQNQLVRVMQPPTVGDLKAFEKCLDRIQQWLEEHGVQGIPEQVPSDEIEIPF